MPLVQRWLERILDGAVSFALFGSSDPSSSAESEREQQQEASTAAAGDRKAAEAHRQPTTEATAATSTAVADAAAAQRPLDGHRSRHNGSNGSNSDACGSTDGDGYSSIRRHYDGEGEGEGDSADNGSVGSGNGSDDGSEGGDSNVSGIRYRGSDNSDDGDAYPDTNEDDDSDAPSELGSNGNGNVDVDSDGYSCLVGDDDTTPSHDATGPDAPRGRGRHEGSSGSTGAPANEIDEDADGVEDEHIMLGSEFEGSVRAQMVSRNPAAIA